MRASYTKVTLCAALSQILSVLIRLKFVGMLECGKLKCKPALAFQAEVESILNTSIISNQG